MQSAVYTIIIHTLLTAIQTNVDFPNPLTHRFIVIILIIYNHFFNGCFFFIFFLSLSLSFSWFNSFSHTAIYFYSCQCCVNVCNRFCFYLFFAIQYKRLKYLPTFFLLLFIAVFGSANVKTIVKDLKFNRTKKMYFFDNTVVIVLY